MLMPDTDYFAMSFLRFRRRFRHAAMIFRHDVFSPLRPRYDDTPRFFRFSFHFQQHAACHTLPDFFATFHVYIDIAVYDFFAICFAAPPPPRFICFSR